MKKSELKSIIKEVMEELNEKSYETSEGYFTDKKVKEITNDLMNTLHDVQIDYLEGEVEAVLNGHLMGSSKINYASLMLQGIKFESVRKQIEKAVRKEFGGK